jgi:hypothetical protein
MDQEDSDNSPWSSPWAAGERLSGLTDGVTSPYTTLTKIQLAAIFSAKTVAPANPKPRVSFLLALIGYLVTG